MRTRLRIDIAEVSFLSFSVVATVYQSDWERLTFIGHKEQGVSLDAVFNCSAKSGYLPLILLLKDLFKC